MNLDSARGVFSPVEPRLGQANTQSTARSSLVGVGVLLFVAIAGCGSAPPNLEPPSVQPTLAVAPPSVRIDQTWTAVNGTWTFTGQVDPQGDRTDVVLEIGPGPAGARHFDTRLPVVQAVSSPGPLTITTRQIPDIDEICVRFTATNSGGTTWTTPLCFPHDLPSFAPLVPS